ncbi:UDP-N-acetylmuramate dehydrogenase [Paenilisteria rocourtiae]|uniref:UDP-N-acetylenolpyruvoylglucosamine reductase n=1 Tax=Listeria rocourtiae TaxID=647910 RepID=A0A4R6ZPV4_9LIST|nr:UDP-N-acetylmuramate dehydrogenase [Listeria rocourtiae]MBC1434257.1 UDP-N-acetylmuramate dehydrogenase [Listeria rocourtiae]MBC1603779.1 UDP-N-acetylmuramate dehydrogenase [Listeria rocourtiae]TDR54139.1 UDP-N-acetylmuramate dehydrogenase [Listeria rocourtiae]
MYITQIVEQLKQEIPTLIVKVEEDLAPYTFTKTGGKADLFVMPTSHNLAAKTLAFAYANQIPLTILGNGSNLIIKDGGIRGIVMYLDALHAIKREGTKVIAGCGAKIIDVSRFALAESLSGLEFACGIPGSVGGALYMNAGAYGGEISDVLIEATVLTVSGELLHLKKDQLEAKYRRSSIADQHYIVLEAVFELALADKQAIRLKMDELTEMRESKQPLEYPSCGSVFKRPPGHFAGKLIQEAGLQGYQIGGAQVSMKHAGFIVNIDHATATDYMELIAYVQKIVLEQSGILLETEVKIIGEDK